MLLFNQPGIGEEALMSMRWAQGLVGPEAAALEGPMWKAHGSLEALQKPGTATAALSWYRCDSEPHSSVMLLVPFLSLAVATAHCGSPASAKADGANESEQNLQNVAVSSSRSVAIAAMLVMGNCLQPQAFTANDGEHELPHFVVPAGLLDL